MNSCTIEKKNINFIKNNIKMKRIGFVTILSFFALSIFAQKYDEIKGLMAIGQYTKAKELFEKNNTHKKFFEKADGYLIKAALFSALSLDSNFKSESAKYVTTAEEAFNQYKAMDPSSKLLSDPVYQNTPYYIYEAYYNDGVTDLNSNKNQEAFDKLIKAVDSSDYLIEKKIHLVGPIDTAINYYVIVLADIIHNNDALLKYGQRFANLKINSSKDYENVYQGLVRYFAIKNDDANFDKYKALGKELYPESEYFNFSKVDFALGITSDFNEKLKNLETIISKEPTNYKAILSYSELIFDTLNSRKEGAVIPANAEELEGKLIPALQKANELKPTELQPLLLLGDHYTTKSNRLLEKKSTAENEVTKKGSKATAADKKVVADLNKEYLAQYERAVQYFEKTLPIFESTKDLSKASKNQYKIAVGIIADYWGIKKDNSGGTDKKAVQMEAKYNDLYDKVRKM